MKINLSHKIKTQLGFTMIELLVVISILGILAVAVLSAINPIEQINRGRDTQMRSDAEQMLNAIDRYNAFRQFYPWQENADESVEIYYSDAQQEPVIIGASAPCVDETANDPSDRYANCAESGAGVDGLYDCSVLERLSIGDDEAGPDECTGSNELKSSYVNRINSAGARDLFIYNRGNPGDSTYVCFIPQSGAFEQEASDRCAEGLPEDIDPEASDFICASGAERNDGTNDIVDQDTPMICLP